MCDGPEAAAYQELRENNIAERNRKWAELVPSSLTVASKKPKTKRKKTSPLATDPTSIRCSARLVQKSHIAMSGLPNAAEDEYDDDYEEDENFEDRHWEGHTTSRMAGSTLRSPEGVRTLSRQIPEEVAPAYGGVTYATTPRGYASTQRPAVQRVPIRDPPPPAYGREPPRPAYSREPPSTGREPPPPTYSREPHYQYDEHGYLIEYEHNYRRPHSYAAYSTEERDDLYYGQNPGGPARGSPVRSPYPGRGVGHVTGRGAAGGRMSPFAAGQNPLSTLQRFPITSAVDREETSLVGHQVSEPISEPSGPSYGQVTRKPVKMSKARQYRLQTEQRIKEGKKPHLVQTVNGTPVTGDGKGKWYLALRGLVDRFLRLDVIDLKDQSRAKMNQIQKTLDSEFEYYPTAPTWSTIRDCIGKILRNDRQRLKAVWIDAWGSDPVADCPPDINTDVWEKLKRYWMSESAMEKSAVMKEARAQVKDLSRLGSGGFATQELKLKSAKGGEDVTLEESQRDSLTPRNGSSEVTGASVSKSLSSILSGRLSTLETSMPLVETKVTRLQDAVSELKGSVSKLTEHVVQNDREHKKAMEDMLAILKNVERSTSRVCDSPSRIPLAEPKDGDDDKNVDGCEVSSDEGIGLDDGSKAEGLRVGVIHGGPKVLEDVEPLLQEHSLKLKTLQCNLAANKFENKVDNASATALSTEFGGDSGGPVSNLTQVLQPTTNLECHFDGVGENLSVGAKRPLQEATTQVYAKRRELGVPEAAAMEAKVMAKEKSKEVFEMPVEVSKRQTRTATTGHRPKPQPKGKRKSPSKLAGAPQHMQEGFEINDTVQLLSVGQGTNRPVAEAKIISLPGDVLHTKVIPPGHARVQMHDFLVENPELYSLPFPNHHDDPPQLTLKDAGKVHILWPMSHLELVTSGVMEFPIGSGQNSAAHIVATTSALGLLCQVQTEALTTQVHSGSPAYQRRVSKKKSIIEEPRPDDEWHTSDSDWEDSLLKAHDSQEWNRKWKNGDNCIILRCGDGDSRTNHAIGEGILVASFAAGQTKVSRCRETLSEGHVVIEVTKVYGGVDSKELLMVGTVHGGHYSDGYLNVNGGNQLLQLKECIPNGPNLCRLLWPQHCIDHMPQPGGRRNISPYTSMLESKVVVDQKWVPPLWISRRPKGTSWVSRPERVGKGRWGYMR